MKDIKEHKHILICGDNINSLNIARSLGEKDISPIVIMQQEDSLQKGFYAKEDEIDRRPLTKFRQDIMEQAKGIINK